MTSVSPFQFQNQYEIRTLTNDNGEVLFVGKDVAAALGYADHTNAMKQHCKGVVKHHPLQTAGGKQEARVLTEADVLRLIVNSKLPAAEAFERWVFEEVLPSIRKTGAYAMPQAPQAQPKLDTALLQAVGKLTLQYSEEVETLRQEAARLSDRLAEKEQAVEVLTRFKDGLLTLATRLLRANLPRELRGPDLLRNLDKYHPLPEAGVFRFLPQSMQVDTLPDGTPWGEQVVSKISALLQSGHTKVAVSRQLGIPCKHVSAVRLAEFVRNDLMESLEYQKVMADVHLSSVAGLSRPSKVPPPTVMSRQHAEITLTLATDLTPLESDQVRNFLRNFDPQRLIGRV